MPPFMVMSVLLALFFLALGVWAQSPTTIQLQARAAPPGLSLKRRATIPPFNLPLKDFFLGTDLQWYGNISVGTPPQELSVVFDPGSTTLELTSTLCGARCAHQRQFNSSESATYIDGGRNTTITFSTGVGVDPVVGDNYSLKLRSGSDTVSIGGLTVPNVSLYLIWDQTPTFDIDPFDGIQGMSADSQGFFASLVKQGLPSLFSLYLTPKVIGNAELTLGGIDKSKFNGNPMYSRLIPEAGSTWTLSSPGIFVNGRSNALLNAPRYITFDSGTSNIVFSTDIAEAIYALISPEIRPNAAEPGTYGIPCDWIPSLPSVIDIAFHSETGVPFNLTIPSSELSVGPFASNSSLCQTLINAFDGLQLVGASLLKHYYSIWDVGHRRMGFAPTSIW